MLRACASWLGALSLCVLASGCAFEEPATGILQLGTGETRFEAIEAGQSVELINGVQGGWHVWLSLRAEGLSSERAFMSIEAEGVDGGYTEPSRLPVQVWLSEGEDGVREMVGWPAELADPACAADQMMRFRVRLEDEIGTVAEGEQILIPFASEGLAPCSEP